MADMLNILRILQGVIVVLGLIVIYYATKGYRRTMGKSLLFLALGFMFVTIGAVFAGFLFELLNYHLVTVNVIQSAFEVVGFLCIVYSIIGTRD
ncbi:MAG: hypothetical protein JRN67_04550 [Nitrososphaerota archaeon]|nr:hypothetical protein [Nitrososphaerota archaeon]